MKAIRHTAWAAWAALMGAVLMLAACDMGASGTTAHGAVSTATPTVIATTAPTAMATSTAPPGWHTYQGPHFTISYPVVWTEATQAQGGSTASQPIIAYAFTSPDGKEYVSVTESDNIDAATIQGTYCKGTSGDQVVTFAGLPMRFSQQSGSYRTRSWVLITNAGTVYQLYANDFLASAPDYSDVVAQNTAVLSTFQAQYTTPGC